MNQVAIRLLQLIRNQLEDKQDLRKIVANTGWLFVDRIFRIGVGLVVGVWIARYLGPEQFGLYNYAIAFVSIFTSFATLGLDSIVVRDLVRTPTVQTEILGTAFFLKLISGLTTLITAVSIITLIHPTKHLTHWLVGIIAARLVFQSFDAIDLWFQSKVESKYTIYAKNTIFILITFLNLLLIKLQAPLIAFAWINFIEIVLVSLGLVVVYQITGQTVKAWRINLFRAKNLLNDSWPIILSGTAIYIQARIDQVMLGGMVGDLEVGQYSAALRLIEVFGFVPMIIHKSVTPKITQSKTESETVYFRNLLQVYRLMTILFLVIAIPLFLFSNRIVVSLYGHEYQTAGLLLSLSSVRLFFTNFGVARSLYIINENLFKHSLMTAAIGCMINIFLNYVLIPKYASAGSIIATIISFLVTTFIVDLFFKRTRENVKLMVKAIFTPWVLTI